MTILEEVLSACVCLAERAGHVIREVQRDREGGAALQAELKDASDERTYLTCADQRAQKVIVDGLRGAFPAISIVGEEDEEDASLIEGWVAPDFGALDLARCSELFARERADKEDYSWVELADLTVFVDPVDGTREFVQGRVEACQTLIGVAIRGKPCAGAIGLPFHTAHQVDNVPTPRSAAEGLVAYGAVGYGIAGDVAPTATPPEDLRLAFSASNKDATLDDVIAAIGAQDILKAGGCGYKILRVLTEEVQVALLNLATSLWDTCATSALVAAQGGKVTTLHGNPIEHTAHGTTTNRFGVVITSAKYEAVARRTHDDLCKALKAVPSVHALLAKHLSVDVSVPQACDLVRDITGVYYTADDWSRMLAGKPGCVAAYSAADGEAERYKQSYACRIRFTPGEGAAGAVPESVFYKRVVLRDMPYAVSKAKKTPFKLTRDIHSCKVEADFLHHDAVRRYSETAQVTVALPFAVQQDVYARHQIDSRFGLILKDLRKEEGWAQAAHLDDAQLTATIRALAYFHAFFWAGEREGADPHGEVKEAVAGKVWPVATYWDLKKQPAEQVDQLPAKWEKERAAFAGAFRDEEAGDATVGPRLAALAAGLNAEVHGCDAEGAPSETAEYRKYKTVIHGDAKPANFFFRRGDGEGCLGVGVIDFQWTGYALGVVDVAYCIMAGIHPSLVTAGEAADAEYVSRYHCFLKEAFVVYGVARDAAAAEALYPAALCMKHYESAFLDLARTVIGDHWGPLTPEILRQRDGKMAFNGYNKSLKVAVWVAARIKAMLDARS